MDSETYNQKTSSVVLLAQGGSASLTKKPFSPRQLAFFLFGVDVLVWCLSWRSAVSFFYSDDPILLTSAYIWTFVGGLALSFYYIFDLYKPDDHVAGLRAPGRAILANLMAFLWSILVLRLAPIHSFESHLLKVLGICFGLTTMLTVVSRYAAAVVVRNSAMNTRWLFVGSREDSLHFLSDFKKNYQHGELYILAPDKFNIEETSDEKRIFFLEWSSFLDALENSWSGIILGLGADLDSEKLEKLMRARFKGTKIYDLTDYYEKFWIKIPIYNLKNQWFIVSHGFSLLHNNLGWRVKRLMDLFVSGALMVLGSPIFLILAALVRLDSDGPVFFKQARVGLGEREFTLYKFRSMFVGSEFGDKYTQTGDNRITRVGYWLRLFRLDELPQLINVFKGEMSLIGPRAEWIKCTEDYEKMIPYYHHRHLVRPGITGWAQVLYPYGASLQDAVEKLQYDLYYIKNYTLLLDFAIFLKTIRIVLFGKGR